MFASDLRPMFGGAVLMNETATKDKAVMAALTALAEDNFTYRSHPTGRWNISDRHQAVFFLCHLLRPICIAMNSTLNASRQTLIAQGYKVTVLKPRRARRAELVMSMTKGVRTNTNRRGQAYGGGALRPENSIIEGDAGAYFKTSG